MARAISRHTFSRQLANPSRRRAAGSGEQDAIVTGERKSRLNMDIALPGMILHSGSNFDKPPTVPATWTSIPHAAQSTCQNGLQRMFINRIIGMISDGSGCGYGTIYTAPIRRGLKGFGGNPFVNRGQNVKGWQLTREPGSSF
jgi:hypothetical protein